MGLLSLSLQVRLERRKSLDFLTQEAVMFLLESGNGAYNLTSVIDKWRPLAYYSSFPSLSFHLCPVRLSQDIAQGSFRLKRLPSSHRSVL